MIAFFILSIHWILFSNYDNIRVIHSDYIKNAYKFQQLVMQIHLRQ